MNVRFACDSEEETGGHSIVEFLAGDERGADAALICDGGMATRDVPPFAVATRGLVDLHLTVRTGERDLHSGLFGGVALNAIHALMRTLHGVRPGRAAAGAARVGLAPPTDEELAAWDELLRARSWPGSARPPTEAAEEFYLARGRAVRRRERDRGRLAACRRRCCRSRPRRTSRSGSRPARTSRRSRPRSSGCCAKPRPMAPSWRWTALSAAPGLVPPDAPAVQLAHDAFEQTMGRRPLLVRSGGTLPIVPALVDRGIPTILTGFATPESNVHSPNERLLAEYVPLGIETARELYRRLAA